MDFVAVDVETANANMASICQIGIASFVGGVVVDEWSSLINPRTHFDEINVSIHGIDEYTVRDAPVFRDAYSAILERMQDKVVVTHSPFDRLALGQASKNAQLTPPDCKWLDSAKVTRRTWVELSHSGYGLANTCRKIGYQFKHHDALEDAKAAGEILLAASKKTGLNIDGWLERIIQPIDPTASGSGKWIERTGDPDGPLYGELIVFTGALQIARNVAADLAAKAGCSVGQSVTKKTTLLCVGDQDVKRLSGHEISSKQRKAEQLIADGQPIRILRESDFIEMVGT